MAARTATRTRTAPAPSEVAPETGTQEVPVVAVTDDGTPEEQIDPPEALVAQPTVIVTGSTRWTDVAAITEALTKMGQHYPDLQDAILLHTGTPGAASIAAQQWSRWGKDCRVVVALRGKYGRTAYARRNYEMVDGLNPETDLVISFTLDSENVNDSLAAYAADRGVNVVKYHA